jgi:prepilin-type N-terminal cleavage/methylation domain-containing protein
MKRKKENKIILNRIGGQCGFTLLEMVVSLSIISLMLGVFLANYKGGRDSGDLSIANQQLVSDIRSAQNKALGTAAFSGVTPVGGWGVHLDTSNTGSYFIFADINGDKKYNSTPTDEALLSGGGQTISLSSDVVIDSFWTNGAVSNPTALDITFLPPDPATTILYNSGIGTSSVAKIILKQKNTGKKATTTVNILGLLQAK